MDPSRLQAIARGDTKYSGWSCGTCESTVRYTSSGQCCNCAESYRTKRIAKAKGRRTKLGEPCPIHGTRKRFVRDGVCVACRRERQRAAFQARKGIAPLTRAEAKAMGKKTYTGGKECEKHCSKVRYTSNGLCIHCAREKMMACKARQRQKQGEPA